MEASAETLAQPRTIEIAVKGNEAKLVIRAWTMGQRAQLKPKLERLVRRYGHIRSGKVDLDLGTIISECESELIEVAQLTVAAELERRQIKWDDLHWEDLVTIIQAIWETSMVRPGGGGMLGKLAALVGPSLIRLIEKEGAKIQQQPKPESESGPSPSSTEPKPKGSHSSADEATETLST